MKVSYQEEGKKECAGTLNQKRDKNERNDTVM
jgi:hypothetical protein